MHFSQISIVIKLILFGASDTFRNLGWILCDADYRMAYHVIVKRTRLLSCSRHEAFSMCCGHKTRNATCHTDINTKVF